MRRITSGEMATEFMRSVEAEVEQSGLPEPVVMIKQLVERALTPSSEDEVEERRGQVLDFVGTARKAIEDRRARMQRGLRRAEAGGPIGEELSHVIVEKVMLINVEHIREDQTFKNTRLKPDPLHEDWTTNEGQRTEDLMASMSEEGLKVPIVLVASRHRGDVFFIRAGFRRWTCAKKLKWKKIPAIVLPPDTTDRDGYWFNILENVTRKSLSTYETAMAAKLMRDSFDVSATEFASKTGYSEAHVHNLLGCVDKLPEYLLDQWREGARLSFDQWVTLSRLEHENAISLFNRLVGINPRQVMRELETRGRKGSLQLAPTRFLDRMQALYIGIEGSNLDLRTRGLALMIVEFCQGERTSIPGVYDPRRKKDYARRAQIRRELHMPAPPDLDEPEREMPPPVDEVPD